MADKIDIPILRVAGVVEYQGRLAEKPFRGTMWGAGVDGDPVVKDFVPFEVVQKLVARIEELEAAQRPGPVLEHAAEAMP